MDVDALLVHRFRCRLHVEKRAIQRRIPLSPWDIDRLERSLERLRPAFERPGVNRYRLTLKHDSRRLVVIYDTRLCCLVSLWPMSPFERLA